MRYSKKPISISDQVAHLKAKGLTFSDESIAELTLSRISYYRLRAYTYPFQDNTTTIPLNQNKMKQTAAIMILVWAAIFALFISKLSEQKAIEPAEEHKFTFVNHKDWARDTTMAPGKTLTLDRIYEQAEQR